MQDTGVQGLERRESGRFDAGCLIQEGQSPDGDQRVMQQIVPAYPDDPEMAHLSGKVHLRLKIEADGRVVDADVVSSTPPGVFDAAARDAFRAARFSPARIKGRPVRALVLIEVLFEGEGYAP